MGKRGKIILVVLLCLSVVFLAVYTVANYEDTSTLSAELKEKIKVARYKRHNPNSDLETEDIPPLIWYDENGQIEEYTVWRYVGTYGDCIALLQIGNNQNAIYEPLEMPYLLDGLPWDVYYPNEAIVYLYNTAVKNEFGTLAPLPELELYNVKWLSNFQMMQLTRDIEKISKVND